MVYVFDALTVISQVAVPAQNPEAAVIEAVMVAVPAATPVISPVVELTLATPVLDDEYVMVPVEPFADVATLVTLPPTITEGDALAKRRFGESVTTVGASHRAN